MKTMWKLQDAKSQFSKVVEDALNQGPQYVTKRGVESVVVLSVNEYENLTSSRPDFKEFLVGCPKVDDFKIERNKDYPRELEL